MPLDRWCNMLMVDHMVEHPLTPFIYLMYALQEALMLRPDCFLSSPTRRKIRHFSMSFVCMYCGAPISISRLPGPCLLAV